MDLNGYFIRLGRASFWKKDGTRRADDELLREFGPCALRLAKFDEYCRNRLDNHFPLCFPPRLFVSYKFGSEAENRWVRQLSEALRSLDLDIVHDEDRDETVDVDVESFVSRIADCSHFIAVITDGYWKHALGSQPTWVSTEFNAALTLASRGAIQIVGVLREIPDKFSRRVGGSTDSVTATFHLEPYSCDMQLVDLPDEDSLSDVVKSHFKYEGPILTDSDRENIGQLRRGARHSLERGDREEAIRIFEQMKEQYPFVRGGWYNLITLLIQAGRIEEALNSAHVGARMVAGHDMPLQLKMMEAKLLRDVQRDRSAMRVAIELAKTGKTMWAAAGSWIIGSILSDDYDPIGARNQFVWARRWIDTPDFRQNYETVLGRVTDSAAESYLDLGPPPWVHCEGCDAVYPIDPECHAVCGDCGAMRSGRRPCPHCGNRLSVPVALLYAESATSQTTRILCPICHRGRLTVSSMASLSGKRRQ